MRKEESDFVEFNNIKDIINSAIQKYPDSIAFTIKNKKDKQVNYRKIDYKEFGEEINSLGTALIDLGLKDKRIAIISKNRYEWMLSYCSVLNGVGIVIPLDKGLPDNEIILSLQRSKADAIIFEESYANIINNIKENKNTNVSQFIMMDNIENSEFINIPQLICQGKKLIERGDKRYIESHIDNDKMSILLFTSGTTSLSKVVMLSHRNIASNISAINKIYRFYNTDVNIAFLPFHHTFGSTGTLLMLSNGVNNVFCDGLRHIQENLKEYKVSVFIAVPLILESMHKKIMQTVQKSGKSKIVEKGKKISKILKKVGIDIRRKLFKEIIDNLGGALRLVVTGAAAINRQVCEDFNTFGITTIQGYGLTETSPVLTGESNNKIRYGSVGFPLCNVQIKIDEPNKEGIGEIIAKGPNVMLGYYEDEETTKSVIKDGWFHTGDMGYLDKDNYLFVSGRKKSVIVLKNGKNIYPEELEELLTELPYVEEALVFGYPKDDNLIISAKIVYNNDYIQENYNNISKEELENIIWKDIKEKVNSNLTNFKHIKKLIITDEPMIKTTTAKIKRFEEINKILSQIC